MSRSIRRRGPNLTQALVGCVSIGVFAAALIFAVGGFILLIGAALP